MKANTNFTLPSIIKNTETEKLMFETLLNTEISIGGSVASTTTVQGGTSLNIAAIIKGSI